MIDPKWKGATEEFANEIEIVSIVVNGIKAVVESKIHEYIDAKTSGLSLRDYIMSGQVLIIVSRNSPLDKEYYD